MKDIPRMTLVELANLYNVDKRTFKNTWLATINDLGEPLGYYYSPRQVRRIFSEFDTPAKYKI